VQAERSPSKEVVPTQEGVVKRRVEAIEKIIRGAPAPFALEISNFSPRSLDNS
jgi:hypothetical protein